MENNKIHVPVSEMIPYIKTAVENGGSAEMTVTGNSMLPLLKDRISSVRLYKAEHLRKGNIVLFQKNDGHYALHRILSIRGDRYDMIGDNQYVPDRDVPFESIIAKVIAYNRTGKRFQTNDSLYRFFLPGIRSVRYFVFRAKRKIRSFVKRK